jgi:hypothetical protein
MSKSRRRWLCEDCGRDTGKMREHYFLRPQVWTSVHPSNVGMLCVGCIEARLGRELTHVDFTDAHVNDPFLYPMSDRLRSRITK